MTLTISDFGKLGIKKFSYIYCSVCNNDIIPCLIKENSGKLPENATIIDVLNKWDKLDFPVNYLDLAGCLIPNEQHIHVGPNGRRYILRPTEHVSAHLELLRNKSLVKEVNTDVKSKNLAKDRSENITLISSSQKTSNNTKITIKHNKKLKMANISGMMDPRINITEPSKDCLDSWSKKFMLKTIHTGANKMTLMLLQLNFMTLLWMRLGSIIQQF